MLRFILCSQISVQVLCFRLHKSFWCSRRTIRHPTLSGAQRLLARLTNSPTEQAVSEDEEWRDDEVTRVYDPRLTVMDGRCTMCFAVDTLHGVCGGIAEYLGVDPVIIRILWIIGTFAWGFGILLYIICWIIIFNLHNV